MGKVRVASCESRVASDELQVASEELQEAGCELPVSWPRFARVPDAPGIWIQWSVKKGRLGSVCTWEEFVLTDRGMEYRRVYGVAPDELAGQVWYGPLPRDWEAESHA